MFDVEKQIEQWRAALSASETLSAADVSELENHLREEIENLSKSGLSNEEAFLVARRRLGAPATVEEEFAKVAGNRRLAYRAYWMAVGILSYLVLLHLSECATELSAGLAFKAGLRGPFLTALAFVAQMATFVGVAVIAARHHTSRPCSATKLGSIPTSVRTTVLAACAIVVLWLFESFARLPLLRTTSPADISQYWEATAWARFGWTALMPFMVAGLTIVLALRDRRVARAK